MNKALIIGPFPGPTKGISFQNEILYNGLKNRSWKVLKIDTEFSNKIVLKSQFSLSNFKILFRFLEAYKILQVNYVYITIGISFFGVLKYAPFVLLSKIFNKKLIIHVQSGYLETMYNELTGWKKKFVYKILNKRKNEDFIFFGNNAALKKIFNFRIFFSLKKIVKDTYESVK